MSSGDAGTGGAVVDAWSTQAPPDAASPFLSDRGVRVPDAPGPDTLTPDTLKPDSAHTMAPCKGGGNVLHFAGDARDFVSNGQRWDIKGEPWRVILGPGGTRTANSYASLTPGARGNWNVSLTTHRLGHALRVGTYTNARRAPFAPSGQPGLSVTGGGRGCNKACGRFTIHTIRATGTTLDELAATFVQHCECGTTALRGCVYYRR